MFTKGRIITVAMAVGAIAALNRVPQTRTLVNGDQGWF